MSYHGYIPHIGGFADQFLMPFVLEIGVDKGQALFPIVNHLTKGCESANPKRKYYYCGIDVNLRSHVKTSVDYINFANFGLRDNPNKIEDQTGFIHLDGGNSLDILPKMLEKGYDGKFCVILIDGDHNYHTVSRELEYASKLLAPQGIIICDDYDGPGGIQDEFFSETTGFFEEENEQTKSLIKREEVPKEKQGVKTAVDEFLDNNKIWTSHKIFPEDEPIVLFRKDKINMKSTQIETGGGAMRFFGSTWEFL